MLSCLFPFTLPHTLNYRMRLYACCIVHKLALLDHVPILLRAHEILFLTCHGSVEKHVSRLVLCTVSLDVITLVLHD